MDQSLFFAAQRRHPSDNHILILAALFWLFTYAVISLSSELAMGDAFNLLTGRRLVAVTAGAATFWLALKYGKGGFEKGWASPGTMIATIVPAALAVLLVRTLWDAVVAAEPLPVAVNIRWVLLWSGYFGLWIGGYLAFQLHRHLRARAAAGSARTLTNLAAARAMPRLDDAGLEWVADVIIEETATPVSDQLDSLAEKLRHRAGYEAADSLDPRHNERIRLVRQVAMLLDNAANQARRTPSGDKDGNNPFAR